MHCNLIVCPVRGVSGEAGCRSSARRALYDDARGLDLTEQELAAGAVEDTPPADAIPSNSIEPGAGHADQHTTAKYCIDDRHPNTATDHRDRKPARRR